jgi:signal transduction histidine kinase/ActR/RegA family two-component response regulator
MKKVASRREHLVQFYEDDGPLLDTLTDFVASGLGAGAGALVIATAEHRDGLDGRLRALGVDVDGATAAGRFLAVDAAETLAGVVVDGAPDEGRFRAVVGELLGRIGGNGPTRVFGEMVGLLMAAGNAAATVWLEHLWNELLAEQRFSLFCAYPMRHLGGPPFADPVAAICDRHDRIVPAESYPRHDTPHGRLSAIVALQQQASSLQAEVAERSAVETALRAVTAELEEQVADLRRLHEMSARLTSTLDLEPLLREVLDAVLAVQDTRMGLLALCDPETPLTLRVHRGFDAAFVEEIERVPFGGGAWGVAYTERRPVVVEDTETDPVFHPYRDAARRAGFRACQSTPLFTRGGDVIGVLSVHFAEPRRPAESERLIDLYVRIAADAIENAQLHERLQKELDDRRESLAREHRARAQAEIANRMKDEFLANVSHELRTPLNAVLGWAHILRTGRPDEATLARGVEVIERNAQAQAKLIEDILDVSRAITGTLSITHAAVDLGAVINAAADSVRAAAQSKGIALTVILDPSARHVIGDAGRLQQAVWNVLSNAVKFTHRGGKVEVRLDRTDGHAQIQVTDTGEGIPSDFLPFVFERFRQVDSTITRRHGGLGLGLTIVRHLIELHGGAVRADSAGEGYGTTVVIELPLTEAGKPEADTARTAAPPLKGVQVLVVDDDHDALDMLARLLTDAGAAVRTAASANEAMSLLRWIRPDVLVSDLAMPDEDGYCLIRNVRAAEHGTDRATPAVALTAYVRIQDRARAVAAGFNMFVEKPVDPDELISVIGGIVDSRGGPREERRARSDPQPH